MKSSPSLKLLALLGVSLVVLLAYGTSSYAESLGDEAAKAALARKAATDAANAEAALQRKCENGGGDWKRGRCITPQDKCKNAGGRWTGSKCDMPPTPQEKCEKNGGDWKKGKCVMPPPPEPTPKPKPTPVPTSHYRINGDGTVTDTQRGLMWKQCSEGQSGSGCSGTAATYKWDDAMSRFGNGVSFAGYSDWRMPTKDELKSLVYCSNGTPTPLPDSESCGDSYQSPTINQQTFPNTPSGWYWSFTAKDASVAWSVGFYNGYDHWDGRGADYAVRLVRSGQ